MNSTLMKAILAMDSYNRGYSAGLDVAGNSIGNATIKTDSFVLGSRIVNGQTVRNDEAAGFYAIAYDYKGEKVISYRGTDDLTGSDSDIGNGWVLGAGNVQAPQGKMAVQFYQDVVKSVHGNSSNANLLAANISLTGHSLGGGLSGYIASLYHKNATVFDSMGYTMATGNTYWYATQPTSSQYYNSHTKPILDLIYNGGPAWETGVASAQGFHINGEILVNPHFRVHVLSESSGHHVA